MISSKTKKIPQALSIYINQLVYSLKDKGREIKVLSLGEAYFTMPQLNIHADAFDRGYHYGSSQGSPKLRQLISDYYNLTFKSHSEASNVLLSCGSKIIIYMTMLSTCDDGDEVLIHEPAWLSYTEQARLASLEPKFIPYNIPLSDFEKYITSKTKLLIICNPNNPAGFRYNIDEVSNLYNLCVQKGIYLLVDEAYNEFYSTPIVSALSIDKEMKNLVVVNSLSKNFGMSGWRIGYAITNKDLNESLLKTNQHLITCVPTVLSEYVEENFNLLLSNARSQIKELINKRDIIETYLKDLKLDYMESDSTFYIFVDVSSFKGKTIDLVYDLLFNHDISVVPGECYGDSTNSFVRVSIGTESLETIFECLNVIKDRTINGIDQESFSKEIESLGFKEWK